MRRWSRSGPGPGQPGWAIQFAQRLADGLAALAPPAAVITAAWLWPWSGGGSLPALLATLAACVWGVHRLGRTLLDLDRPGRWSGSRIASLAGGAALLAVAVGCGAIGGPADGT